MNPSFGKIKTACGYASLGWLLIVRCCLVIKIIYMVKAPSATHSTCICIPMFAPCCPKCPADLTCLFSSPPTQKNWQRLCRALSSWLRPSKETARSKFHWLEGTALTVTAETSWQLHKQDSCARCHCLAGAHVDSNAWSPNQPPSPSLPALFSFSELPTCNHWMASPTTSNSFTLWAQPLISHHPLHPLLYSSHIEPTFIPQTHHS